MKLTPNFTRLSVSRDNLALFKQMLAKPSTRWRELLPLLDALDEEGELAQALRLIKHCMHEVIDLHPLKDSGLLKDNGSQKLVEQYLETGNYMELIPAWERYCLQQSHLLDLALQDPNTSIPYTLSVLSKKYREYAFKVGHSMWLGYS